ncbi:MAG TPA: nucleotidyltransferase family protein [Burkholderiaceae bacterium]
MSEATVARHHRELAALALATPWFLDALRAARGLGLADWCIGAGAVRNLVWDALHGHAAPSPLADVDLAHFDPSDMRTERDHALQARVQAACPALRWEVTNQAGVHLWFEAHFGHAVGPLRSLDEAVGSWPEFATAVGVALGDDGGIRIVAPHGLDDLFAMVVRHNPARASVATYRERVAGKRHAQRWPRVRIVPA